MPRWLHHPAWAVGAVLVAFGLPWGLSENAEINLGLAKQWAQPGWLPGSFTHNQWPGGRITFVALVGPWLRLMSFETADLLGKLLSLALLAWGWGRMATAPGLRPGPLLAWLLVYLHLDQAWFGGAWWVGGFEAKSLAYGCMAHATAEGLRARWPRVAAWTLATLYLHPLVGGWWALAWVGWMLWSQTPWRRWLPLALAVGAAALPFALWLMQGLAAPPGLVNEDGLPASWVYVYGRGAHHLAPWASWANFRNNFLPGVPLALLAVALLLAWRPRTRHSPQGRLWALALGLTVAMLAFIPLSGLDLLLGTQGKLLTTYPFRLAAWAKALAGWYLVQVGWARARALRQAWARWQATHGTPHPLAPLARWMNASRPLLVLGLAVALGWATVRTALTWAPRPDPKAPLYAWVLANTPPGSLFLYVDEGGSARLLDFERSTRRPRLVTYKGVPTLPARQLEWERRIRARNRLAADVDYLPSLLDAYPVDYILSDRDRRHPWLKPTQAPMAGPTRLYRVVAGGQRPGGFTQRAP